MTMRNIDWLLMAATSAAAIAAPAFAQEMNEADILVTAQRENRTEVTREGSLGALGTKAAENVPFSIKSYNAALILNQQPQTLGQVLENDPSVRTSYGFGNAAEQFIIRGFALYGDEVARDAAAARIAAAQPEWWQMSGKLR